MDQNSDLIFFSDTQKPLLVDLAAAFVLGEILKGLDLKSAEKDPGVFVLNMLPKTT